MVKRPSEALNDSYEAVFTALAHPARRLILMTLNFEGGEMKATRIEVMPASSSSSPSSSTPGSSSSPGSSSTPGSSTPGSTTPRPNPNPDTPNPR